ncbi:unnamed protein product [Rotaria socialis]|uniref:Uncharacterized protein n=1 Tax=Rotaria socialis TaxID=392032 RepID=A0A820M6W7_9BILA|nr:unnamed protein product [Rotaria socialis]
MFNLGSITNEILNGSITLFEPTTAQKSIPPSTAAVLSSRASTLSRQQKRRLPATPSEVSSNTIESEHLPPIVPPPARVFRHNSNNDLNSIRRSLLSSKPSSTVPKKYITKTMSTTTTMKKTINGGPVNLNGKSSQITRTASSESNQRIRKLWWSPKRNEVHIRSQDGKYKHVTSKVGSLANIQYQPGGGQISIRDEAVQWNASSKINSLVNASWSPPTPQVTVRTEKLKWDVQPKIGSLDNVDYKPAGGNVEIRDEKLDLAHVVPRVDCGFIE